MASWRRKHRSSLGGLKYMMHIFPNHELGKGMILQNFYGRLSIIDRSILDTYCSGSFMKKSIEYKWDLLEWIKRNSEDWEIDKGNGSGINFQYDCVKYFVETNACHSFSEKYGLDSEIVLNYVNPLLHMLIYLKRNGLSFIHLLTKLRKNQ